MKIISNHTIRATFISILVIAFISTSCQDTATSFEEVNAKQSSTALGQTATNNSNMKVPPGLIKNSVKYADNSMPASSGRDGAVQVTALAMIDVDGNTDLEVTTGDLNNVALAPGTITKLQIKALDHNNPNDKKPLWVDNQNKLNNGGYFKTNYSGLSRGQLLSVHSNVKGIIRGTAVVFMNEYIKARPDIQVSEVGVSSGEIKVDEPITIFATILESNGDLGANASCVLYIDGEIKDRSNNIWVDAGDIVTCQFETSFESTGEKHIVVKAEDVNPGDYDYSNNDAYTSINVVESQLGGPNGFFWSSYIFMSNDYYNERRYPNGDYNISESKNYLYLFNGYKNNVTNF